MAPPSSLSVELSNWACTFSDPLPGIAIERGRAAFIDTVACMLAGARDAAAQCTMAAINGATSGDCSVVGSEDTFSAPWAALANGVAAHALDFDDNFFPAISHASAVLVPALFALGEEVGATLSEVLRAYVVGLEIQATLGEIANPVHYELGWHATSTLGTIGAAVACANLLRLDPERTANALSIGVSLAGGSKRQFGSMTKPVHAGFAAMNAVLAARLAAAALSAQSDPLEGKWGFFDLYAGKTDWRNGGWPPPGPRALAIEKYGLVAKLYPSCMSSHLGIDGLLALQKQRPFRADEVGRILIAMPPFMLENLRFSRPRNELEARFSMQYCGAVAIVHGCPKLTHFVDAALADDAVMALLDRVEVVPRVSAPSSQALPWGGDCSVDIFFKSGEHLNAVVCFPKGCLENPISSVELGAKFVDCASSSLSRDRARALFNHLQVLDLAFPVGEMARHLRKSAKPQKWKFYHDTG
ncbi:MAG: MmgE/PrpD family protein [Vulcanimicrobiaceae bacterium]